MAPRVCLLVCVAYLATICQGFLPRPATPRSYGVSRNQDYLRLTKLYDESSGRSPLPDFNNLVTPKVSKAIGKDSPLDDRALDSALDFLQEGEADAEEEDDEFDLFDIYEESPEIEIPHDLIASLEEQEAVARANKGTSAFDLNSAEIKKAVEMEKARQRLRFSRSTSCNR